MGILITIIMASASFALAKILVNVKPEVALWSVNKKQAVALVWFAFSTLVFLGIKAASIPDFAIENYLIGSASVSVMMGVIFYSGLSAKKQTA